MVKLSASTLGKIAKEGEEAGTDALTGGLLGGGIAGIMTGTSGSVDAKKLSGDIIGAGGQELLEYGIKKALSKQATSLLAKQVSSATLQQAGAQVAKQVASAGIRTTISSATKLSAGIVAKTAVSLAGGPIGLALLLISLTLGFMDMFWNPWKNYDNKDLKEMIDGLNTAAKKQFEIQGFTYPMTIKPNIQPQTEVELNEFKNDQIQYLKDRNLILPQEALEQLTKRLDDYDQYRMRKVVLGRQYIKILEQTASQFQTQEQAADWEQIKSTVEASQLKNTISDKMANYLFISITQEDTQTNRTQLLLFTALLYKKGLILPPSQRTILTDIKQYIQVYWLRLLFYLSCIISIILCSSVLLI